MSEDPLKKLSPRKRKYVKGLVEGKSKTKAAIEAGYSKNTAVAAASHIDTPDVQAALKALIQQTIPIKTLARRLKQGLSAKETKFATFEGKITDHRDCINFAERRAYVELVAEMGGFFQKVKPVEPPKGISGFRVLIEHIGG